jgi:hypothetical protein
MYIESIPIYRLNPIKSRNLNIILNEHIKSKEERIKFERELNNNPQRILQNLKLENL